MAEIGTQISKASQLLENNELVAIPTETVYGLAGNALEPLAIAKIYTAKDRPSFDPLITHVTNIVDASALVHTFPALAQKLAEQFWPGPLTLLLPKREHVPDVLTSGLDKMAIRVPNHPISLNLLKQIRFPLAAPSANPFGYVSPTTAAHVNQQLGAKIPYILDGGPAHIGLESTIVSIEEEVIYVHRLGGIDIEMLKTFGEVNVLPHTKTHPNAPGQLDSHYAPRKKIIIGDLELLLLKYSDMKTGILSFSKTYPHPNKSIALSPDGDVRVAAEHLFSALRTLDTEDIDLILGEYVPQKGIGRAINDRLKRASFI
jgi:L-threonylcarbamoyladenylate synthase